MEENCSPIDPKDLAIAAGGNAIIFYSNNENIIEEMNFYCPEEYRCYEGSLRIYQPYIDLDDPLDCRRHRYISANSINTLGNKAVVQMIRRALAQDVHFYETFFRIKDCRIKQENYSRQLRLYELKKQHQEQNLRIEQKAFDWFNHATSEEEKRIQAEDDLEKMKTMLKVIEQNSSDLVDAELEKRLQAEDDLTKVQEELKTIKEENYNLKVEIDSYRPLASKNAELERVCNNRLNNKTYPRTPRDIIQYFEATFTDCIAFSNDVAKSLKDCTIPLDELWHVIYNLATVMRSLYIDSNGDIYKEFKNKTGITIGRGEGANTHQNKKLMQQYATEYHGISVDIEAHVKCSKNYQRIHFGFSKEDQKVIIGWCGQHKDNATTQRVK